MSRSAYSEECNGSELSLWRGAVKAAMRFEQWIEGARAGEIARAALAAQGAGSRT